ncbi:Nn.00g111060.m01.CDS01 [Neocucurbitaria sp. VM-36]
MASLHRQDIPITLLEKFRLKAGSVKLDKAFGSLKGYNMVTENTATETLSMHRLVQLSMKRWLKQEGREGQTVRFREDALMLLSDTFPDGSFSTWDACKSLIVHADTVLENSADTENYVARANLLEHVANFQNGRGQYAAAERKLTELIELKTKLVGADNAETLRAQDALAWTLRSQAKNEEAVQLAQETLDRKQQLFNKNGVEALTTAHIIATIIGDQGKHQNAAALHKANFDARKGLLGLEHLDTLRSAAHLALELWELGKFVEAEDLARDTLVSRTRILGDEHPDTLEIAGTLGFILEVQGKYVEAKELKENMLAVRERIYGDDHPDTADSLHDMGWILHQMGRYEEADPYYERSLAAKQRLLGDDHWKTLTTMCNYPVFFTDMGRYDEAEVRSKMLIDTFKRVQGEKHPQTLDATGGLAVILRHQGKLEEAAAAARTSIDGRNIVLGPGHPWTLPPVSHWGYILTLQGDYVKGEAVIRDALAKLESHMGHDSSNVLTSVVFLSKNLYFQATTGPDTDASIPKLDEAETLAQRALASRKKLLGEDHPYTYKTMHHLAKAVFARGIYEEAIDLARRGLGGLRRVLGGELGVEHADVSRADIDLREMEGRWAAMKLTEEGNVETKASEEEVQVVGI